MKLFEVFGVVKIDSNDADKKLDKTESKGSKLGKTFVKFGKVAAVGIGVASVAAVGFAKKTADATDRVDKMSQKLGLSRKSFQEWDYILSQNGASIDGMGAGMKTLTNQFDELSKGGKVATDAFDKLGLSYEELEGLSQEEIFEKTIVALQGMENETERAAIANDLLGRSGQELAPLLNAGADSVDKLKNKANDLGLVMNDYTINTGVRFTDTMDTLKRSLGAVGLELGTALIPIFDNLATWTVNNMPSIKGFFKDAFDVIYDVVNKAYDIFQEYFLPVLKDMFTWVQNNWPMLKEIATNVFNGILTVVSNLWDMFKEYLLPIFKSVFNFVYENWPTFQTIFEEVFKIVAEVVDIAYQIFLVLWDILKDVYEWVEPNLPAFGQFISDAFGVIVDAVQLGIDIFIGVKDAAMDAIGWIKDALDWLGMLDNKQKVTTIQAVTNIKQSTKSGTLGESDIKELIDSTLFPKFGGFKAKGGPVSSSESYIVGEEGPELFTPGANGSITPNGAGGVTVNTMIVREEADIQKIARELHNLQQQKRRGLAY